jgi:structural maintenance of chromosome 4
VEQIAAVDVRLAELNEVRAAKLRQVRHVERERDNLEGVKDEAEAFIEQEREIRRKQNHLFQAHALDTSRVLQDTGAKCDAAVAELAAEKERLSGTDTELNAMKAAYDTTVKEYEDVCAEVARATDEFTAFERHDVKLQEDMKHSKTGIKKLQSVLAKDNKAQAESASMAESARAEVERLEGSMVGVMQRHTAAEAALDGVMAGLKAATAMMRVELEGVKEKLIDAKRAVSGVETEKEGVAQTLSLSQARHIKATKGLEKARAKLDSVRSQLAECHATLQGADGEQSAAVGAVTALEEELVRLQGLEEELKLALRAAVSAAEEGKASLQSSSGRSGTLDAIMKAGRKGGPLSGCGVRGRLGDLGSISDKYDVAISTACGQLDNIVVDTTAGAQKCVKFLRDNNAGRASFLVLDQMNDHARRMAEPKQLPEGCPRLFDMVKTDDAYRAAFYMALRDTLVAPNLDAAVKVAFVGGRAQWRVVTVEGNLVDTTGAMSGGGKSVKSGGMKSKPVAAASDVSPAQV